MFKTYISFCQVRFITYELMIYWVRPILMIWYVVTCSLLYIYICTGITNPWRPWRLTVNTQILLAG